MHNNISTKVASWHVNMSQLLDSSLEIDIIYRDAFLHIDNKCYTIIPLLYIQTHTSFDNFDLNGFDYWPLFL